MGCKALGGCRDRADLLGDLVLRLWLSFFECGGFGVWGLSRRASESRRSFTAERDREWILCPLVPKVIYVHPRLLQRACFFELAPAARLESELSKQMWGWSLHLSLKLEDGRPPDESKVGKGSM